MKIRVGLFIILTIALASCDSPRSSRAYLSNSSALTSGQTTPTPIGTVTVTATPTSTSSSSVTIPTDISSSCTFSSDGTNNFSMSSTHAGSYSLCKSTGSDNVFYFQAKTSPVDTAGNSVQLCFIPMTTSSGKSIYIGNPMCGYFTSNTVIKKITFVKYAAYSNATISAVMFFKDASYYYSAFNGYTNTLTAFQYCMNALAYGNTSFCNSFKSVGQYVYQTF